MTRYNTKIGLELAIPITVVFTVIGFSMVYSRAWGGLAIILAVVSFMVYLFSNTFYTIEKGILTVKGGFIVNETIEIQTIRKISETNNPISSPAASIDRLEIRYGTRGFILISPKEKAAFIEHLLTINPNIEVKYKKK